jgi:uncharacterized damage-inducible protein DinB
MNYHSVAEIFDDIDQTRARLFDSVEGLSAGEQAFRPAPGSWSVAEILEHLSLVERGVARVVTRLLEKSEAAGQSEAEAAGQTQAAAGQTHGASGQARETAPSFAPVSIAEFVEQTRTQKLNAPESARPAGAPVADSLSHLRDSRAALRDLRARVERADCASARVPHPVWGPLNLYQWLLFLGAHEARHLAQIEALKEGMNAER